MRLLTIAVFLALAAPAHAAPGDLDRGFANDGRTAFQRGSGGSVSGLTLLDGRRPLLSVNTAQFGAAAPKLLTLTAGGRLAGQTALPGLRAPTFADGYALTWTGAAPTRYALGRIGEPAGATFTFPGVDQPPELAPQVSSFAIDGAGRALIAVSASTGRGFHNYVDRFLPGGAPDAGFPRLELARSGTLLVRPDGRLFVLSWVRDLRGLRVQGFDPTGRPLPGFRSGPRRSGRLGGLREPRVIAAGGGGRLLVAGGDVFRSGWVARLLPDGRLDRSFGERGVRVLRRFTPHALARDRHGRIVLAGLRQNRIYGQAGIARLRADGDLDRRFGIVGKQLGALRGVRLVASEARHVAIDVRGRIVIAGEAYDDDYGIRDDLGTSYPAIARVHG